MREVEGEALKKDILAKNARIREITDSIKERAPFVVEEYKEKLSARLSELIEKQMVDEQRMAAEITVFADKCCIDEELTRMYSHLKQLEAILETDGTIGKHILYVYVCRVKRIGVKRNFFIQDLIHGIVVHATTSFSGDGEGEAPSVIRILQEIVEF